MNQTSRETVIIVGAGPVGVVQAMLLARLGYRVQLFEGRDDPRLAETSNGSSINLTLSSRAFRTFEELGIAEEIRALTTECHGRYIHSQEGAPRYHPYGANDEALFATSRSGLLKKLLDLAARDERIEISFAQRCVSVRLEPTPALFMCSDGGARYQVNAERVIACDGQSSTVRSALLETGEYDANVRYASELYRELPLPLTDDPRKRLSPDGLHLWPRGKIILVAIPNLDGSHNGTLFMPLEGEASFETARNRDALRRLFSELFPDLFEALPCLPEKFFRRPAALLCSSVMSSIRYRDSVALVGDAARSVVPYLGQGLNAGLEDALMLYEVLRGSGGEWAASLEEYDRRRVPDNLALQELAFDHYQELAVRSGAKDYLLRKQLERRLEELFPSEFVPLYTMVSFSSRSYAECARDRERQERVIARLLQSNIAARIDTPAFEDEATFALRVDRAAGSIGWLQCG